jgi:ubiquinone/menaquinone biosynthesis C-methylase UbiE
MDYRKRYDLLAPIYDTMDAAEHMYKRRVRKDLFAGLSGNILDAGIGTGRNIAYYPPGANVTGFDVSPEMMLRARERRDMPFIAGDIMHIAFRDNVFDAVVAAFTMSSLDESLQAQALSEFKRVCKPGGEVRILDYRLSDKPFWRAGMRVWSMWEKRVFGCSFERHTERYLSVAGLEPVSDRFVVGDFVRILTARPAVQDPSGAAAPAQ